MEQPSFFDKLHLQLSSGRLHKNHVPPEESIPIDWSCNTPKI
jgi:hypothetical protein